MVDEDAYEIYGPRPPENRDAIALQRYREMASRARRAGKWWDWWMGAGWSGAGRIVRKSTNKLLALDKAEEMLEEILR